MSVRTEPTLSAISPCFIVGDVELTMSFYGDLLGFETTHREPEQRPFFAVIRRDGAQILIKSDASVAPLPNSVRHRWMRWDAFVYVADPDALADEFIARGAPLSRPLEDTHDGLRGFEVTDPDGYVLFFGRT